MIPAHTCHWRRVYAKLTSRESNIIIFLLVGVIGFLADSGIYALASLILPPSVARLCSIWVAIGVTWILNRQFAFTPTGKKSLLVEYTHYLLSSLCGAAVNYLVFLVLLAVLDIQGVFEYAAIFASSAVAACVNFLLYKKVVFAHPRERTAGDDAPCA